MKLRCFWLFLLGVLPLSLIGSLTSQDLNRVTFVNDTGHTLVLLFVSPRDSKQWGPDILLRKRFDFGAIKDYYVHYEGKKAAFDFLAFDDGNRAYLVESAEIRDAQPATIRFSARNFINKTPSLELINVFVTNATNRVISYLFFSPADSSDWGFDILNNISSLQSGGSIVFSVPVGAKDSFFELLAISKDHTMVQRRVGLSRSRGDIFLDFLLSDLH